MTAPGLDPALAAALGALQGVAEFLPISSSGHLALAQQWLGVDPAAAGHTFNIVAHAGTLLAVLIFYRRDLAALTRALFGLSRAPAPALPPDAGLSTSPVPGASPPAPGRAASSPVPGASPPAPGRAASSPVPGASPPAPAPRDSPDDPPLAPAEARALLVALIVGTLPLAFALVPAVEHTVIAAEGSPRWIGAGFLITAALLAFSHRRRASAGQPVVPRPWQALLIGLAQLVAILPGISRSGSTIAAALGLGLGRLSAARFSFLLSIPAILGASAKETLDVMHAPATAIDPFAFSVGFLVSFLVGTLTLRLLVALLVRVGLLPFVPYLVGLGLAVLVWS